RGRTARVDRVADQPRRARGMRRCAPRHRRGHRRAKCGGMVSMPAALRESLRTEDVNVKAARPSVYLFRSAAAYLYAGTAAANGSAVTPTGAAQRLFGHDVVTEEYIRRGATAPATTGGAGWADALVAESVFDLVQVATSLSAAASLIASGLKVSLVGAAQV